MKIIVRISLFLFALAFVLVGVSYSFMRVHASNLTIAATSVASVAKSDTRPISASINQIVLNGPVDLNLQQSAQPELVVSASQNLLSRVETKIDGNTLYISTTGSFVNLRAPIVVNLKLPTLEKLELNGSGDAKVNGFKGQALELSQRGSSQLDFDGDYQQVQATTNGSGDLNLALSNSAKIALVTQGSGEITVKGQTKTLTSRQSGSGDLDALSLTANEAIIESYGSGDAKVHVSQQITARLSGSGDLDVYGNPAKRDVSKSGSGDISWK